MAEPAVGHAASQGDGRVSQEEEFFRSSRWWEEKKCAKTIILITICIIFQLLFVLVF